MVSVRAMRRVLIIACFIWICALSNAQNAANAKPKGIDWQHGPIVADLGGVAKIKVPKGMQFADGDGARRLMELTQNPSSGEEVGVLMPEQKAGEKSAGWIMLFEFSEVGYVTDTDKEKLDSDALLDSLSKGTERANEKRKENGWPAFHITGWSRKPFFDDETKNLTWAIEGHGEKDKPEEQTVNYSTRILGRRGTMNVDLVLDSQELTAALPEFNKLLKGFSYNSGNRYAEFVKGDKVAGYGLTALIAGGAAAAAVKTGLFAKLFKVIGTFVVALWKLIVVALAAIASKIKALWKWMKGLFGSKKNAQNELAPQEQRNSLGIGEDDQHLS